MARQRTSSAGAKVSGAQDIARVTRLRWWLTLGVLIVGYDFAQISMATLSPAAVLTDVDSAIPVVQQHTPPPVANAPDLAPTQPRRTASQEVSVVTADATTATVRGTVDRTVSQQHDRAGRLHPALWQGQVAIGAAVWTCRRLAELPDLLENGFARQWASTMAESQQTGIAPPGDRSRSLSQDDPDGTRGALSTSAPPTRLLLRNRTQTGSEIHFLVNENAYALFPGEELKLDGGRWLIRFHRGGEFGDAAYALWPGSYEFFVTSRGWDLVRKEH